MCNDVFDSSSSIVTSRRPILGNEASLNVDYTKRANFESERSIVLQYVLSRKVE